MEMEDKDYYKIYESKVVNATVKIRKRFCPDKIAKAIIMIAEDDLTESDKTNEQKK